MLISFDLHEWCFLNKHDTCQTHTRSRRGLQSHRKVKVQEELAFIRGRRWPWATHSSSQRRMRIRKISAHKHRGLVASTSASLPCERSMAALASGGLNNTFSVVSNQTN